jgi:hypothetical protein
LKQLFTASLQHIRQSFSITTYVLCFIFIGIACWLNYGNVFQLWPSENSFLYSFLFLLILFLVFFALGFIITVIPNAIKPNIRNKYKWVILLAPVVFAIKIAAPFDFWLLKDTTLVNQNAFIKPAEWLGGVLFMIPALMLLHYYFENKTGLFFIKPAKSLQPYFVLLLLMIPVLLFAVYQPAFQQVYPRVNDVTTALGSSAGLIPYVLFEFCYALDFITIELFFRGMLIAVTSRIIGVHSIVPVALFYFSIHLGKPMLEAISSFFGGLILGAVSYETKSIWGGWIVHCGIAFLMELFAFLI